MSSPPLTVGTAGHVDHGKTALVRALTGKDTDRLPEEHRRGISMDLGFAPLDLPGGRRLSLIDVPGHERFVRTMVAGATGIDLFLMCVAADDGVMPQTREHAAVLRHLGIGAGVVAVTKADAADPAAAVEQARELLPGHPVVVTAARKGRGLDELVAAIAGVAAELSGRAGHEEPMRLHVDRSFTVRGIGTVATGTLWSGAVTAGDEVRLVPGDIAARVRSVQVHDRDVERADAGQRVAVALTGVSRDEVSRGHVLCAMDSTLAPSYRLDAALSLDPAGVERGERLHVHHGTRESPARVVFLDEPGPGRVAQLRLESPLVCAAGDRVVLRRVAPPATVGGGVVLDAAPPRHTRLTRDEPPAAAPAPAIHASPAVPAERLEAVSSLLAADGLRPRSDVHLADALGLEPSDLKAAMDQLVRDGAAVRTGRTQHFAGAAVAEARDCVAAVCRRDGSATIASVRDELGTSRKFAQALLEHLDRTRVTRRDGDEHVLVERRAPSP